MISYPGPEEDQVGAKKNEDYAQIVCLKAYRFVDLPTNKVYYSRYVRFLNEEKLLQLSPKSAGLMEYESALEPSSPRYAIHIGRR